MTYQPPAGARDLLPLEVIQKQWIESHLQTVFQRWGYNRIITSTLERLDTLVAGGAVNPETVIQFQDINDTLVGLRPELTASIARIVATHMAQATFPERFYYIANVFRRTQSNSPTRQQEFFQAGIELLGGRGYLADAEILLLLTDCLRTLGLSHWHVIVGEASLTQALLSAFDCSIRQHVQHAIASLDRLALEALPLSNELQTYALQLLDLRGDPRTVLHQASQLGLDAVNQERLQSLKSLVDLLDNTLPRGVERKAWVLDLSLMQSFHYYSGITFEVVIDSPSGQQVLGQGGRYDQLLGTYHPEGKSQPGIGFTLNLEEIQRNLLFDEKIPQRAPVNDWLVVPRSPQAYTAAVTYAQDLRNASDTLRVELELGIGRTADTIRQYAQQEGIVQIAWINAAGEPDVETLVDNRPTS